MYIRRFYVSNNNTIKVKAFAHDTQTMLYSIIYDEKILFLSTERANSFGVLKNDATDGVATPHKICETGVGGETRFLFTKIICRESTSKKYL